MNSRVFIIALVLLGLPVAAGADNRQQPAPGAGGNIQQLTEYHRKLQADREAFARASTAMTYAPSPMENVISSLVQEVVALRRDNDALKAELDALKAAVKELQGKPETASKAKK
jgi:SMC interacting uncharacterized protein involved in chromosome segregation